MKLSRWAMLTALTPLVAGGCGGFGNAMTAHTDVVARAAGKELKVDEAARILSANPQIPADPATAETLAELWVDYTLLATAAAEDTTLAMLDLDKFTETAREQAVVAKLQKAVVRPDTAFTEQQLQQRWATEGPGAEVRARHILFRVPSDAAPAVRDSIVKLAQQIRARAAGGEDFAKLAQQYSQDTSAPQGGDLGYFGRGRMVAPFEEAAFKLQPGQISDVVESPFGYHVIKVEDRRQQALGEQREQFRQYLVQKAQRDAWDSYIQSVTKAANVQVAPGAPKLARELAQKDLRLRGRSAERVVASYKGGALTAGEVAEKLRTAPPQFLGQLQQASDEQVTELIQNLTHEELILQDAGRRKVGLSAAEQDSIRKDARRAISELLQMTGLNRRLPRGAGASAAVEARVKELLEGAVNNTRQLPQLGPLGFALRNAYGHEINEGTFPRVAKAMQALRPSQPAPGMPGAVPQQGPPQQGGQPVPPTQGPPEGAPQQAPAPR